MKINRSELERVYSSALSESTAADIKAPPEVKVSADKVEISAGAKKYSPIKTLVNEAVKKAEGNTAPEKLLKLKSEVAADSYQVRSGDIAGAILGLKDKIER